MAKELKVINPENITDNTFRLIETDWMLLTAGTIEQYNTMTAAWGGLGILWGKKVCYCFIRPQRHTFKYMEATEKFTLSFFDEKFRSVLNFCGRYSGRDTDKAKGAGITPVETNSGAVYFEEARMVFECKKIYFQDLNPDNFLVAEIGRNYPDKDYHRMYIGEILNCYLLDKY